MLRLASYNIQSGRLTNGGYDAPTLARSVRNLDADLVALQEVDHRQPRSGQRDQLADLVGELRRDDDRWSGRFLPTLVGSPGLTRTWRPATAYGDADEPSYGIALVTRLTVHAWHSVRLGPFWGRMPMLVPTPRGRMVPVLGPDEPRAALAAVVDTELGPMTVASTHLSFLPVRAALQLRHICGWSRALPGPHVLLGDLNLPGGVPQRVAGWRRLADVATFPARSPRTQLDHALADGLEPADLARAHAVLGEVSDHLAVVVDLSRR